MVYVQGCDASVLADFPGGEKQSVHNANSLRGFGVIDSIKQQLEAVCPDVVSCSDILALVAREAVVAVNYFNLARSFSQLLFRVLAI